MEQKAIERENNLYRNKDNMFLQIGSLHYTLSVILVCFYKQFHGLLQNVATNAVMKWDVSSAYTVCVCVILSRHSWNNLH